MTTTHPPQLCLQAEERCRAVLNRHQNIRGTHEQGTTELRKEIADVHLALLALAEHEGIDLHTATTERFTAIKSRDPHVTRLPA